MLQSWGEMLQKDKGEKCTEKAELLGSALRQRRAPWAGKHRGKSGPDPSQRLGLSSRRFQACSLSPKLLFP